MPSNNASVAFRGVDIYSIKTLVPTYGNYCGSGWTAGRRGEVDLDALERVPPIKLTSPNGELQPSLMDTQCKIHDRSYILAAGYWQLA